MQEQLKETTSQVSLTCHDAEQVTEDPLPGNNPTSNSPDSPLPTVSASSEPQSPLPTARANSEQQSPLPTARANAEPQSPSAKALPDVSFPSNQKSNTNYHPSIFASKKWQGPAFLGMAAASVLALFTFGKFSLASPSIFPLSSVHHSENFEGYVEQAKLAYSKADHYSAVDAWNRAIEKAKADHVKPVTIGNLCLQAGDQFSDTPDFYDPMTFAGQTTFSTPESKATSEQFWEKAVKVFHEANLTHKETQARYRLMYLWSGHLNVEKKDNLLAITNLAKNDQELNVLAITAYYELGKIAAADGDYDDAVTYYTTALTKESSDRDPPADAITNVSRVLRSQQKYGQLLRLLNKIIQRYPKSINYYPNPRELCLKELKLTYVLTGDLDSLHAVDQELFKLTGSAP
ncbi:MAG TPA: hypothetical protein V6C76_04625 [Drouetiella sp.]